MDMMSTLNILNSRQIFKEFLKPVSCFRVPFFEIPKFGTVWIWQQKVPQSMKKALNHIYGFMSFSHSNHLTKKDKGKDICVHNMSC